MSPFFSRGWNRRMYSLSDVDWIGPERDLSNGRSVHDVKIKGVADSTEIGVYEHNRMLMTPLQLIAAEKDTYLLDIWLEGDIMGGSRTPVIAWALCADGETRPVTPQGVSDGIEAPGRNHYVAMPDGSVHATSTYAEVKRYGDVLAYREGELAVLRAEQEAEAQRDQPAEKGA